MTRPTVDRDSAGQVSAFAEIADRYSRELHLHCYRMLGSTADAEDVLQETMAAAWLGLGDFEGRSSMRTWLYRIATNRCLNAIRDAKRRPPPAPVPPFDPPEPSRQGEVTWLQPYPDSRLEHGVGRSSDPAERHQAREAMELAFIAALQQLPPRQTAALVLCDVLGFPVVEVSAVLSATPTSVKGLLQRARGSLAEQQTPSAPAAPRVGSRQEADLARRFADCLIRDDIDGVVSLLTDDAWLAMPPAPHEYHGAEAVAGFLRTSAAWRGRRRLGLVATRANTQPAFGHYLTEVGGDVGHPTGLVVLTLTSDRIRTVTRFLDPGLCAIFGLPAALPMPTGQPSVDAPVDLARKPTREPVGG